MREPRQRQGSWDGRLTLPSYEAADTEQLGALWITLLMPTVHSTVDSLRMGLHFFYPRNTFFPCRELNLQGRQADYH